MRFISRLGEVYKDSDGNEWKVDFEGTYTEDWNNDGDVYTMSGYYMQKEGKGSRYFFSIDEFEDEFMKK